MNESIPWVFPPKELGKKLPITSDKYDPIYKQALKEIAADEGLKIGKTIGRVTLLRTLATQSGPEITQLKIRLNKRIAHLTKEKNRHAHQINSPEPSTL